MSVSVEPATEAGEAEAAEEATVTVKLEPKHMSPDSNHNVTCDLEDVKSEPESSGDESSREQDSSIRRLLCRTDTVVVFPEDPQGTQNTGNIAGYTPYVGIQ